MLNFKLMNVFVLDNYDSFTYNLVHYLEALGADVEVRRNDEVDVAELNKYDGLVLSPGPGLPNDAGKMMKIISKYYQSKPILGICLGHQALAEFFGAKLYNMQTIYHGMSSKVYFDNHVVFDGIDSPTEVGRYHSWCVESLPESLKKIAQTEDGEIMAFVHDALPIVGLQFHPESIMTTHGYIMMENWLKKI